jgi:ribosome maturation factor RimP
MQEPTTIDSSALRLSPLHALIERTLEGLGYELVDLERAGNGLLRVTLDFPPVDGADDRQIGIEDCERVSRHLSHLFTVENIDYDRLEVSSPGMDRPLRSEQDFFRFGGELAKVQLVAPIDGRRRFRGRLLGIVPACADHGVLVRMALLPEASVTPVRGARRGRAKALDLEQVDLALTDIEKARLAPEWEFDRAAVEQSLKLLEDVEASDFEG